ncbi:MAG: CmcI family methyltransferase [Phycisphaerales bacterium]
MNLIEKLPRRRLLPSRLLRLAKRSGPLGRWLLEIGHDLVHCDYCDRWESTFTRNRWLGLQVEQLPGDLLIYQEVVFDTKPTLIVQTGVNYGGSALFFASLLDIAVPDPDAAYVGIDIRLTREALSITHPRVTLLEGDSASPAIVEKLHRLAEGRKVMVILDSDHSALHVQRELEALASMVSRDCFLVVEDTHIHGRPTPSADPGPTEGLAAYLKANPSVHHQWSLWTEPYSRHRASFHSWLRRVAAP